MAEKQGEQQMTTVGQAVNVLARGVVVAQKRGAYNLDEAAILSQAMKIIAPTTQPEPVQETDEAEDKNEPNANEEQL